MYNYKIKTSFVRPEMATALTNKIGFNITLWFYILIFVRKPDMIRYIKKNILKQYFRIWPFSWVFNLLNCFRVF